MLVDVCRQKISCNFLEPRGSLIERFLSVSVKTHFNLPVFALYRDNFINYSNMFLLASQLFSLSHLSANISDSLFPLFLLLLYVE